MTMAPPAVVTEEDFTAHNKPDDEEDLSKPFKELTCREKAWFITWIVLRVLFIQAAFLFFMVALKLLSNAFVLIGGRTAGEALGSDSIFGNPICGLMMGVLVTAFLQSSSTSTSIVVTMISAGIMSVEVAIPVIMGANIGTSVTSTLVAAAHVGDRKQFRDAFAAATVHDMFNWLSVFVLLPLELITKYLFRLTKAIVDSVNTGGGGSNIQIFSAIVDPIANLFVQVDRSVLEKIASKVPGAENLPILKQWCKYASVVVNSTTQPSVVQPTQLVPIERCVHMFAYTTLSEPAVGVIVLIMALIMLISCLLVLVKCLKSLLVGSLSSVIKKTINTDLPGKASCFTGYLAMLVGALVTVLVQSSSVTTATLTPLVGLGMVSVERVFPMTLGANIGTTSTSFFAAIASSDSKFRATLQIALCHLFFNLSGIIVWYPLPFMRKVPLALAHFLGKVTAEYRWFAIAYLIFMFLIFPFTLFGLSLAGLGALLGVGIPIIILLIMIGIINVLQNKKTEWLPKVLQTWDFLPESLRSLAPYDRLISRMMMCCAVCCPCCKCCQNAKTFEDEPSAEPEKPLSVETIHGNKGIVNASFHIYDDTLNKDISRDSSLYMWGGKPNRASHSANSSFHAKVVKDPFLSRGSLILSPTQFETSV